MSAGNQHHHLWDYLLALTNNIIIQPYNRHGRMRRNSSEGLPPSHIHGFFAVTCSVGRVICVCLGGSVVISSSSRHSAVCPAVYSYSVDIC